MKTTASSIELIRTTLGRLSYRLSIPVIKKIWNRKIFLSKKRGGTLNNNQAMNKMIINIGSINLSSLPDRPSTAHTKANIWRKKHLNQKQISRKRFAAESHISKSSVQQILREDLVWSQYKKMKQPRLTNLQKERRVKFANWVWNNYAKDDTKKWFFTEEKFFDLSAI